MAIDKKLYRNTYKLYKQWNEVEFVERIRNAGSLSPKKAWGMIETIIEDRMVDLIEIERVGESLREVIESDGVEL